MLFINHVPRSQLHCHWASICASKLWSILIFCSSPTETETETVGGGGGVSPMCPGWKIMFLFNLAVSLSFSLSHTCTHTQTHSTWYKQWWWGWKREALSPSVSGLVCWRGRGGEWEGDVHSAVLPLRHCCTFRHHFLQLCLLTDTHTHTHLE